MLSQYRRLTTAVCPVPGSARLRQDLGEDPKKKGAVSERGSGEKGPLVGERLVPGAGVGVLWGVVFKCGRPRTVWFGAFT